MALGALRSYARGWIVICCILTHQGLIPALDRNQANTIGHHPHCTKTQGSGMEWTRRPQCILSRHRGGPDLLCEQESVPAIDPQLTERSCA